MRGIKISIFACFTIYSLPLIDFNFADDLDEVKALN